MPTREEALAQLTAPGEPYELVRETQGGYEVRVFKNAPATLGDLFADSRSDLPFFVYDDERYSYEEAHQAACRIGRLLVDRYGIGKGDRGRDLDAQLPRMDHVLHGDHVDRGDRRRPQRAVAARGDGVRADRQRGESAVRGRATAGAAGGLLGRRVSRGDRRPARGRAGVRRPGTRRPAARRAARTDAAGRRGADGRRDDPLHLGLDGASEGRGQHASERGQRAAVVGARQPRGAGRLGPRLAGAGPSAGHAARRAALPRDRLARRVSGLVPGAAQDRLDVQVGSRAGGGADRGGSGSTCSSRRRR